jgi:formylglycine-generating enzyme required for sulfatase activity
MQLYPGITITGAVGNVYSIQATTNVAQTNGWITVGVIQLPKTNYVWFDPASPTISQRFYRTVAFTNVLTNMIFIPAGTFVMGKPTDEAPSSNNTQHVVTISKGFFIGKFEVTQTSYVSVIVGSNPSHFSTNNPNNPVENISWSNATNYCAFRSAQEFAAGKIPSGWAYRLPTESEWEYACRSGSTSAFYFGSRIRSDFANFAGTNEYDSIIGDMPNTNGVHLETTTPVGSYSANGWGLYDMAGNVAEWCQDMFDSYPTNAVTDPVGTTGEGRVVRGGSWSSSGSACRSAARSAFKNPGPASIVGLRVVLAPTQ